MTGKMRLLGSTLMVMFFVVIALSVDVFSAETGNEISKGPAAENIASEKKPGVGEISIDDFEKALLSGEAVILDVRSALDYAEGHFKGALHMSLGNIAKDYSKLPKDKRIITYCETGARAEMAYDILKKHGYDVNFLKAKPAFAADGSYKIEE